MSIADSNAEGAVMIQRRINELVAAGYTEEQIQDYFIDKYGEWILLEPKPEVFVVRDGRTVVGGVRVAIGQHDFAHHEEAVLAGGVRIKGDWL